MTTNIQIVQKSQEKAEENFNNTNVYFRQVFSPLSFEIPLIIPICPTLLHKNLHHKAVFIYKYFPPFSDHVTSVNAEDLFDIKILNLSTPDQVTPGSILGLELEINR